MCKVLRKFRGYDLLPVDKYSQKWSLLIYAAIILWGRVRYTLINTQILSANNYFSDDFMIVNEIKALT